MKIYKWTSLILKACQCLSGMFHRDSQAIYGILLQLEQNQTGQKMKPWRNNAKELREKAWQTIENWDIRLAKRLFDIFPRIIAKKYQGQMPVIECDEKNEWVVIFS